MTGTQPPPTYPSPRQVLALIEQTLVESGGGLIPTEVYLKPSTSWDGRELTLAWVVGLVSRESHRFGVGLAVHEGAVHSSQGGVAFSLCSGEYCLPDITRARIHLGRSTQGFYAGPSFILNHEPEEN